MIIDEEVMQDDRALKRLIMDINLTQLPALPACGAEQ